MEDKYKVYKNNREEWDEDEIWALDPALKPIHERLLDTHKKFKGVLSPELSKLLLDAANMIQKLLDQRMDLINKLDALDNNHTISYTPSSL